jgi:hypothetical protein
LIIILGDLSTAFPVIGSLSTTFPDISEVGFDRSRFSIAG